MSPTRLALIIAVLIPAVTPALSTAQESENETFLGPNVQWTFRNMITACPAGDSVLAGHPSRLRMLVTYTTGGLFPEVRVGVPPESVWVDVVVGGSGNLKLNNRARVFADDSTNADGQTSFNIGGFSGAGTIRLRLSVSGDTIRTQEVTVRSTDSNADGVTNTADESAPANLDYDFINDPDDLHLVQNHEVHGHRQLLLGQPVRRTDLCANCEAEDPGSLGDSELSWAPSGTKIAHSAFVLNPNDPEEADCRIFISNANSSDGNAITPFSHPGSGIHDYDPTWSPLGTAIVFDRHDNTIVWKNVAVNGVSSDTTQFVFYQPLGGSVHRGAVTPAFSPNGAWVACSVADLTGLTGGSNLWLIPASGDTTLKKQLTSGSPIDFFPAWSPDGKWIYFDRTDQGTTHEVCRVRADTTSLPGVEVLYGSTSGSAQAVLPSVSPDGNVFVFGAGSGALQLHTLGTSPSTGNAVITNYPDYSLSFSPDAPGDTAKDYIISPRWAPDGTRIAFRARPPGHPTELPQVWVTRRNMFTPPQITSVGGVSVNHAAPYLDRTVPAGTAMSLGVSATSTSGEPLTYAAYFLRSDLGMAFNPSTHIVTWTPSYGLVGNTYNVKVTVRTPSGGTDYAIARLTVVNGGGCEGEGCEEPPILHGAGSIASQRASTQAVAPGIYYFDIRLGRGQEDMSLSVYNVAGRKVREVLNERLPAGAHRIAWRLDDQSGRKAAPGVYFARLEAGGKARVQRLILLP